MKKVIITGVTGQDGSLMADYLLNNFDDIEVYGTHRRLSVPNHGNIEHLLGNKRFKKIELDITDNENVTTIIRQIKPDYFINFAANSFVGNSWRMPMNHFQNNCISVMYILEALKNFSPSTRFYNAGSSEQFGDVDYVPQDIKHPFKPRSPYGASKCAAHHLVKVYRESFNMFAVQGILFNHEGIRRGEEFVTRKITKKVAEIKYSIDSNIHFDPLELGNLYSKRDWSDAEDFIDGIWKMLNQPKPVDYVLSSGKAYTIKQFVEEAFKIVNIKGTWIGEGLNEKFISTNLKLNKILMVINSEFYRPAEVDLLLGDNSKAINELGWRPKTDFNELVNKMVKNDYNNLIKFK
jgi:GDPmannose 4,6-dehydratase